MALKIYNSDADLLAKSKETLVEIIKQLHCTLQIPEVKIWTETQVVQREMKKCQCCRPFCCLKVNV